MRRTKDEAEQTRRDILEAALTVFSSKGYSATKLDEIAEAANVTRGAIYWHFQNKAGLYYAVIEEFANSGFIEIVESAYQQGGTILEIFRRIGIGLLQMVEFNPKMRAVMELIGLMSEEGSPELRDSFLAKVEIVERAIAETAQHIQLGIDNGDFREAVNALDAARGWWAYREGLTRLWLMNPSAFSIAERAPDMMELFLQSLIPPNKQ